MPAKRALTRRALSYGWVVFLVCIGTATGIMIGWSSHKAIVNISGENIGFIKLAYDIFHDNPSLVITGTLGFFGLVLQAYRTFSNKRTTDK